MIREVRQAYNQAFSQEKYDQFLDWITSHFNHRPPFAIAETPVFIPNDLKDELIRATEEVIDVLLQPNFSALSEPALVPGYIVPNETSHTAFLQMDFGICKTAEGKLIPQMVEVQGFPSLYFYQNMVAEGYRKFFNVPEGYTHLLSGITTEEYFQMLRNVIVANHEPENVVLLEIDPFQQMTVVDFYATRAALGIGIVGIKDVKRSGRTLYYINEEGKKVAIHRIFNRVIFDELVKQKGWKEYEFTMLEDVDVEWAGHPNWFFRISKHTLPIIKSKYVPESFLLSDLKEIPADLSNFVLKPLYSFSGAGVIINVEKKDIDAVKNPEHYLLQRKVEYVPVIETLDIPAKCEVRMLMIWEPDKERPRIVNNLVRLSKGAMIGVRFNKDKTWVGGSVGFFEK